MIRIVRANTRGTWLLLLLLLTVGCSSNRDPKQPGLNIKKPVPSPVLHSDSHTVTVRLRADTEVSLDDIEWDSLRTPEGAMVAVADYDSYAEVRFDTRGRYVIQATGFRGKGSLTARDTAIVTVR